MKAPPLIGTQKVAIDMATLFMETSPSTGDVIGGIGLFLETFIKGALTDKLERGELVKDFCDALKKGMTS